MDEVVESGAEAERTRHAEEKKIAAGLAREN